MAADACVRRVWNCSFVILYSEQVSDTSDSEEDWWIGGVVGAIVLVLVMFEGGCSGDELNTRLCDEVTKRREWKIEVQR